MSAHLTKDGKFLSDKYAAYPVGAVEGPALEDTLVLKLTDPSAQDLLWTYAERRREEDAEFADDLQARLRALGYDPDWKFVEGAPDMTTSDDDWYALALGGRIKPEKALEDAWQANRVWDAVEVLTSFFEALREAGIRQEM